MHPAVKILGFIFLAIAVNLISLKELWVVCALLAIMLILCKVSNALRMIFKMRWLIISLFLIYALNTPGEYLHNTTWLFSPTYEGLYLGSVQMLRLLIVVQGLALLSALTSKNEMLVGLYQLANPVKFVGLSPERFAARLWLTLHYVEDRQGLMSKEVFFDAPDLGNQKYDFEGPTEIRLLLPSIKLLDVLSVFVIVLAAWLIV